MRGSSLAGDRSTYLAVLLKAYRTHYLERTDVWTDDPAMRCIPALVQGQLKLPPSASALDVGCGSGRDVEYLSHVMGSVVGIDIIRHPSWRTILENRRANVRFVVTDFLAYESVDRYELILDNGCFHHQHEVDQIPYLAKAADLLAPSGRLALSTFNNPDIDQYIDDNGRLHRYFGVEELYQRLAAAGLEAVHTLDVPRLARHDSYRLSFCRRLT